MSRHVVRRVVAASIAVAALASGCGSDSGSDSGADSSTDERSDTTIEITGRSFRFEPDEIRVHAGQPATLRLTALGDHHDLVIDAFDFHVAADQGERSEATLSAPTEGRYPFYCSVPGHRDAGMEGTLVVGP